MIPHILIPAFQPEQNLITLVQELLQQNLTKIIVVDDGSGAQYQPIFLNLPSEVVLLTHATNQGKGAAIKTGLQYLADQKIKATIITMDADGQHLVEDVKKIYHQAESSPDAFILGVRQFDHNVPWRSRFGNELSRKIFRWLYKYPIEDTQTGLRAIPAQIQPFFLTIEANRYEYESECLIAAIKQGIKIIQVPIQTVYIENNRSSHFNPIIDSIKIYYVFFRYSVIAFLSFLIDISLFAFFHFLTNRILLSLVVARVISGGFNFYLNKYKVYYCLKRELIWRQLLQYTLLCIFVIVVSYPMILGLVTWLHWNVVFSKIVVDLFLFLINFVIQKKYIFRHHSAA